MLETRRPNPATLRTLFLFGAFALTTASATEAVDRNTADATNATATETNDTIRIFHPIETEPQWFEAFLPSGRLKLDVAVPGQSTVEPRLVFHGLAGDARGDRGAGFAYLERSATSIVLEIRRPGSYLFCVAAQDPLIQLGEYKLTNAFVGDRSLKNGDPDEDEPDPEPIAFACGLKNGDPDEDEPDPESIAFACGLKNGDPDEDEPDPESIAFGLGGDSLGTDLEPWDPRLRDVLAIMCRSGEVDDHGDTVACATRSNLGHAVVGEIRNDWGDDLDFFTFRLNELRTVEIGTAGWTDTFGSLYDRSGHRLATDDDSGDGDNFRIATTLAPGWYFVRVEGQLRDEGAYSLSVNASSW